MKFPAAMIILSALSVPSTAAFQVGNPSGRANLKQHGLRVVASSKDDTKTNDCRPVYDPMGLYPENSDEKKQGRIYPLEPKLEVKKPVNDPMGIYPKKSPEYRDSMENEKKSIGSQGRPIYDPMGLYPESSQERQEGWIESMEPQVDIEKPVNDPLGLYPKNSPEFEQSLELEKESLVSQNRDLYDPLGLYPASSEERQSDKIKPLEPQLKVIKPVRDPLGMYPPTKREKEVDDDAIMSEALPFVTKPTVLDGELAGDVGFDPLGLAKSKESLYSLRQAEVKHARLAMLAAVGWPLAELWDKKLAALAHLKPLLVEGGRVPSVLNGGLANVNPFYWMGVLVLAGFVEVLGSMKQSGDTTAVPGDLKFDPFGLYPKNERGQKNMQLAEIKNGRLAMLAITGFALQEAVTKLAVVDQTPFFFHLPF